MEKSNEASKKFRQEGNEFYKNRNFLSALIKYNQSLCFAETKSENSGHAYANRSAVYFELKLYDKCLSNIERAIENHYPVESVEVLNKRKIKCNEKERKINQMNFFKLSHCANKKLPFIIDCLEVKSDDKYGRFIVTNKNLSIGDVIAIEKPFCCVPIIESNFVKISELNNYQRCNNCLRDNQLDLIPCETCCETMFCSFECFNFAMKYYHQYECVAMNEILKSASVNMSLRLFFIGLSIFNHKIEDLKEFFVKNENSKLSLFDFDFSSSENLKYIENYYTAVFNLSRSDKKFSLNQHESILSNHPLLTHMWNENRDFILKLIQRACQISDHNFHGIFNSSLNANEIFSDLKNLQQSIGSGSLPFTSLINHSCSPNILRICTDGKVALIACRPIKKGSQIFDCYKLNFLMEPKESRQRKLLTEFGFTCDCEACTKNYPNFKLLQIMDMKLLKIAKKMNDEIQKVSNKNQVLKKFIECKDLLQSNFENYPLLELCVLQKVFATLLLKLAQSEVLF